jgi:hypothetical protein
MTRRLFVENFVIEREGATATADALYDESRGYAVTASGAPAVEADDGGDDEVKTATFVASEGLDVEQSRRALFASESTVTRVRNEAPDQNAVVGRDGSGAVTHLEDFART